MKIRADIIVCLGLAYNLLSILRYDEEWVVKARLVSINVGFLLGKIRLTNWLQLVKVLIAYLRTRMATCVATNVVTTQWSELITWGNYIINWHDYVLKDKATLKLEKRIINCYSAYLSET